MSNSNLIIETVDIRNIEEYDSPTKPSNIHFLSVTDYDTAAASCTYVPISTRADNNLIINETGNFVFEDTLIRFDESIKSNTANILKKQDTLTAGENISIAKNATGELVISSTGGGGGSVTVEQTFNPTSANAISGAGVNDWISTTYTPKINEIETALSDIDTVLTPFTTGGQTIATEADITTIEGNITNIEGDITALENADTLLGGRITSLENAAAVTNGKLSAAEADITTIEGDITNIEGDITALENADTALSGRITTNENDISDLQAADTALGNRITATEADITTLEADITTLENADTALSGRITTNENDIIALEAADTALGNRITTAEGDINDLDSRVTANTTALDSKLEASDVADVVRYSEQAGKSTAEQAQARTNIGAQIELIAGTGIEILSNGTINATGTTSGGETAASVPYVDEQVGLVADDVAALETVVANKQNTLTVGSHIDIDADTNNTISVITGNTAGQIPLIGTTEGSVPVLDATGKLSVNVLPATTVQDVYPFSGTEDTLEAVVAKLLETVTPDRGDIIVVSNGTDIQGNYVVVSDVLATADDLEKLYTADSESVKVNGVTHSSSGGIIDIQTVIRSTVFTGDAAISYTTGDGINEITMRNASVSAAGIVQLSSDITSESETTAPTSKIVKELNDSKADASDVTALETRVDAVESKLPASGTVATQEYVDAEITALNLGTASTANTGTAVGQVPTVGADGKLPASVLPDTVVDATTTVKGIVQLATSIEDGNTNVVTSDQVFDSLALKQNVLTAGDNIEIDGDTINVVDVITTLPDATTTVKGISTVQTTIPTTELVDEYSTISANAVKGLSDSVNAQLTDIGTDKQDKLIPGNGINIDTDGKTITIDRSEVVTNVVINGNYVDKILPSNGTVDIPIPVLPTNDKYNVVKDGTFIDLFETKVETETTGNATGIPVNDAVEAYAVFGSKTLNGSYAIRFPDNLKGKKIKNVRYPYLNVMEGDKALVKLWTNDTVPATGALTSEQITAIQNGADDYSGALYVYNDLNVDTYPDPWYASKNAIDATTVVYEGRDALMTIPNNGLIFIYSQNGLFIKEDDLGYVEVLDYTDSFSVAHKLAIEFDIEVGTEEIYVSPDLAKIESNIELKQAKLTDALNAGTNIDITEEGVINSTTPLATDTTVGGFKYSIDEATGIATINLI